jgi:ABC-type glycerol-3-phosphate transport system substrate-binding protein
MQQLDAWELLRQEVRLMAPEGWQRAGRWQTAPASAVDGSAAVTDPEFLRSRTRTRRRRRKRSWGAPWSYLLPVLLVDGTLRIYKLVQDAIQEAFLGNKTPKLALDEAAEAANLLIRGQSSPGRIPWPTPPEVI